MDDRLEDPSTTLRAGPGQAGFIGDVPAEGFEEGVEELGAELFFFVVRGQEDPMVLAKTVYEAEKCVGGRTHRREDSREMWGVKSKVRRQKPEGRTADRSGDPMQVR